MAADPLLRQQLIGTAQQMAASGLNKGTAGNLSVRHPEGFLITPTGMDYAALMPEDIPLVGLDGISTGRRQPSSEWRFHRDIYAARPEAGAVLHAHSPFAVSLACLRLEIPAFHYMIARFGGANVRCAEYATFGTQALSDAALAALRERSACLLANHGMLVLGRNLETVLALGIEFETLCEHYWRACQLGSPVLLSRDEMTAVLEKFGSYGQAEEHISAAAR
ncbi:MAG: class II aldolase/adducin family protein [Betaproteobacteria bacterium]